MTTPTVFETISDQPEATDVSDLFIAAESQDTSRPTNKVSLSHLLNKSSEVFNYDGLIYKGVGNISDFAGQQLKEDDKTNAYQYPDNSRQFYAADKSQAFPITIPADPSIDDGWALVNAVTSASLGGLTNYQAASVADMIAGKPAGRQGGDAAIAHVAGYVWSTGVTTWKIVNTSGLPVTGGLFARAMNGLWMNDFGMTTTDPETGVGAYNDAQVAEAETVAQTYGWTKKLNSGWYRLANDWIMKSGTSGMCSKNTVILFDSGKGFRNYTGSDKYLIKKIKGIRFESDKESKWNATDAGDAFVSGILRWDVRNLYGQRVAKGNKTTTPNNILSNDPQEQQDGNGFWSKDYGQWAQTDGVAPDRSALPDVVFSGDENVLALSGDRKVISECEFSGFEKNLVISAGFENDINNNVFRTSNYGVVTFNESYTGGSTSNRVTATNIDKNSFYDCDVSHYANDFLQSKFRDNVCQPAIVGMFVGGGGAPQTEVSGNYFEIGHTLFEHLPNLPMRGSIRNNFTNSSSTRYLAWVSNGQLLNFMEPKDQNQKIHFDPAVQTSRIEQGFDLDVDGGYFVNNGNEYSAGVTKEYYIKTTGVGGTTFTIEALSQEYGISLKINPTQSGIVIPNTPKGRLNLINVQMLSGKSIATYFDPQVGDPRDNRSRFFWDTVSDSAIDLRVDGQVKIIKISYNQEPTYVP